MYTNFSEVILELIEKGYEGDYWDFKEEWHTDNERLIHDILCFSNTIHDKDCYLIIGVSDTGEIKGLDSRKNHADVFDLLRSIQFAGDYIPNIAIETLEFYDREIDVIVIKNSDKVPYYIRKNNKKFNKLKEIYIYSRTGDSNTPINQNSNINVIENLWKKRLGIDKPVKERILKLLADKENWERNSDGYYHILSLDFTIIEGEYERDLSPMFYSALMCDKNMSYKNIYICCKGVKIHELRVALLDGARYQTNTPEHGYINFDKYHQDVLSYRYYVKDTLEYNVHKFLFDEESEEAAIAKRRFAELILYFKDEAERFAFENYIRTNEIHVKNTIKDHMKNNKGYHRDDKYKEDVITALILKEQLKKFRLK